MLWFSQLYCKSKLAKADQYSSELREQTNKRLTSICQLAESLLTRLRLLALEGCNMRKSQNKQLAVTG